MWEQMGDSKSIAFQLSGSHALENKEKTEHREGEEEEHRRKLRTTLLLDFISLLDYKIA
jgi:hypothetical protein